MTVSNNQNLTTTYPSNMNEQQRTVPNKKALITLLTIGLLTTICFVAYGSSESLSADWINKVNDGFNFYGQQIADYSLAFGLGTTGCTLVALAYLSVHKIEDVLGDFLKASPPFNEDLETDLPNKPGSMRDLLYGTRAQEELMELLNDDQEDPSETAKIDQMLDDPNLILTKNQRELLELYSSKYKKKDF